MLVDLRSSSTARCLFVRVMAYDAAAADTNSLHPFETLMLDITFNKRRLNDSKGTWKVHRIKATSKRATPERASSAVTPVIAYSLI